MNVLVSESLLGVRPAASCAALAGHILTSTTPGGSCAWYRFMRIVQSEDNMKIRTRMSHNPFRNQLAYPNRQYRVVAIPFRVYNWSY